MIDTPIQIRTMTKNELREIDTTIVISPEVVQRSYQHTNYYNVSTYYLGDQSYVIVLETRFFKNLTIKIHDRYGCPYAFIYQKAE